MQPATIGAVRSTIETGPQKRGHNPGRTNTEPEPVVVDPAQCWGPYVLRAENPICECGSKYFQESGTVCNVKKFCVCCRSEIFLVDFA